jgi:hypothetical protein
VIFDAVNSTGWGHVGRYVGGDAETISGNGIAVEYGISASVSPPNIEPVLLFRTRSSRFCGIS